jgi:hypothetical protein
MKKISKTFLYLTFFTVLVVIILSVAYLMFSSIRQSNNDTSNTLNDINQFKDREKQIEQNRSLLTKYQEDIDLVGSYFIAPQGVVPFIENIESYARGVGAEPEVSQLEIVSDSKDFKESLHLLVTVRGAWSSAFQFLNLFEHLPYYITIKSIRLTKGAAVASLDTKEVVTTPWELAIDATVLKLK